MALGFSQASGDALFDLEVTGARFEDADEFRRLVFWHSKAGPARLHLGGGEFFDGETMLTRCAQDAGDDDAFAGTDFEEPRFNLQPLPGEAFKVLPQAIAFQQQRHIVGMFEIGLPDDARLAVRTSFAVGRVEAVDAEDAQAATC